MPRQNILYKNVYHALCSRIFKGEFKNNEKLPSINELAEQYHVSVITIRSTFKLLQDMGIIQVSRGKEAIVKYDPNNKEAHKKNAEWLCSRYGSIKGAYTLISEIVPTLIAFGGKLCTEEDFEKLTAISEKLTAPNIASYRRGYHLIDFMALIIDKLNNSIIDSLFRETDKYLSLSLVVASLEEQYEVFYSETLCSMINDTLSALRAFDFSLAENTAKIKIITFSDGIISYIEKISRDYHLPLNTQLDNITWHIYDNSSLYSNIATDLLMKISCGDYSEGEFLPSEQKLQGIYHTSSKTIRSALMALNECDLVKTLNGIGTMVTYTTPAQNREDYRPDIHSFRTIHEVIQFIAMNVRPLVERTIASISDEDIAETQKRIEKLLNLPDKGFYSYTGILIDLPLKNYPNELSQYVYRQFTTRLFLSCHKRRFFSEEFTSCTVTSMPFIIGALNALSNRDSNAFSDNLIAVLEELWKASSRVFAYYGINVDVPMPFPHKELSIS